MSTPATHGAEEMCASCGITGGGDGNIKMKNCTACHLVKYCSVKCQREHRPQHKRACKKRAAELKDELLFKQPERSHLGDCPICLIPIPIDQPQDTKRFGVYKCCSKMVCDGCVHANKLREMEARLTPSCPFCRSKLPKNQADSDVMNMKRVEANDPLALFNVGTEHSQAGDYATGITYFEKAAGLGHADSHYRLSLAYDHGIGVEKDTKKYTYHTEQAAIGGHHMARHDLGAQEIENGNIERAVKHFIIAANLGLDLSLEALKDCYARRLVSKEDFAAALRAHQAAVDATKSPQRNEAGATRKMKTGVV